MATVQENSRPRRAAGPALIRESSNLSGAVGVSLLLLIPAAVISPVFHVGPSSGLPLLSAPRAAGGSRPEMEPEKRVETVVQADPPPEPETKDPLTIDEVDPAAQEPDVNITFNYNRTEDNSVPGPVNPDEPP